MPIIHGTAEIIRAVVDRWEAGQLDRVFRQYWALDDREEYSALHDKEAGAEQPWPYCVCVIDAPRVITRMSAGGGGGIGQKNHIRDIPLEFHVYAKAVADDEHKYSAKEYAAVLAGEVMAIFGGHPIRAPLGITGTLDTQYVTDVSVRDGDAEWHWMIRYNMRADMPVAV